MVILPAEAGEKHFNFEEPVKLVNPRITAEGYKIGVNTDDIEHSARSFRADLPLI